MRVKDAYYENDVHDLVHYYNLEAGSRGLSQYAYARPPHVLLARPNEGVTMYSRDEFEDVLIRLQVKGEA